VGLGAAWLHCRVPRCARHAGPFKSVHDAVYGNFSVGVADHAAAIAQLCKRNAWMDAERVGIMGHVLGRIFFYLRAHSGPGYLSCRGCLPRRATILGKPSITSRISICLRGAESRTNRPDLIKQASKVTAGRLMSVVGSSDHFIVSSAMKMTRALIEEGIDHECVVIPHAFHQFAAPRKTTF